MTELNLDQIQQTFAKHTELKSICLLRDIYGKDILAAGKVLDVTTESLIPGTVRVSLSVPKPEISPFNVFCDFINPDDATYQQLRSLEKSQPVNISGDLDYFTRKSINLRNCKLHDTTNDN